MTKKKLLLRADDLASSLSANQAIFKAAQTGLIKNVSVMAVGPALEDAARLLAPMDLCFGMHVTLNAEWDRVKWKSLTGLTQESGLVDEQGYFLNDPRLFIDTKHRIDVILKEVEAQWTLLTQKGFKIRYVDSHMIPEASVEGLSEALSAWIKEKGLIDHVFYYGHTDLPGINSVSDMETILKNLDEGQYFMVVHPSLDTDEMRMTGNQHVSGIDVAQARAMETQILCDPRLPQLFEKYDIELIRYDQAEPQERIDFTKF